VVRVQHAGEQREIFRSGRASAKVLLADLAALPDLYALGPCAGLDGEITVLKSQPYVSKLRGGGDRYVVDRSFDHGAIFLVWAQMWAWDDIAVPESVASHSELEAFVKQSARQNAIDTNTPFPFLMTGSPRELVWHINVDRTGGQAITPELFRKSKQQYTLRGERVDIFGVYSERHGGIFMSPDLKIHIHFVSRDSGATGHIDAITPAAMTLRLPRD